MADASSMSERAAIVVLAAKGGRLLASDLRLRHGVDLKRPFRERLARQGLIETQRDGRSFSLKLTDAGWSFVDDAILTNPPGGRGVGPGGHALLVLLSALGARNVKLSALLRGAPPMPPSVTLEGRVERAYNDLAREKREWVALTALRQSLADIDRATLDTTIKQMHRDKKLILTLEDDQSRLTKADRDAALKVGSDNMHYLSMG